MHEAMAIRADKAEVCFGGIAETFVEGVHVVHVK